MLVGIVSSLSWRESVSMEICGAVRTPTRPTELGFEFMLAKVRKLTVFKRDMLKYVINYSKKKLQHKIVGLNCRLYCILFQ